MAKTQPKRKRKASGSAPKVRKSASRSAAVRPARKVAAGSPRKARPARAVAVLVGTRKGAWLLTSDDRRRFQLAGPHFFGQVVNHVVADPRAPRTLVAAVKAGHLGPTVFRSTNFGKSWKEATRPPAFPKAADGTGRTVELVFWLTPGHASEPGVWWAGSVPHGLFRSADGGDTWEPVSGFNDHPERIKWSGGDKDGPPDGATTHSIIVDSQDPKHMYLGISGGGFFESLDQGAGWQPLNGGVAMDFMPEELKEQPYGHDPHCVVQSPAMPSRLYMQNHCGSYRIDRPETRWTRIGDNMPRKIRDIGFPIVAHPRDPDVAWVFPMDGGSVWPRTSIDGKPAVYRTRNAGRSWERQDKGLPPAQAYYTVKRQCFAADDRDPVGLYFGTTSGHVWGSRDEGASWHSLAIDLPHVYSVAVAPVP